MLKGLKIEFEPVLKSRRDFLGTDGAVKHLGWIATKKINEAKKPSTWGATTSIVMAFLVVVGLTFMVQGLLTKLEWYGKSHNVWWVEDVLKDDPVFENTGYQNHIQNNYISKPIIISLLHDIVGIKTAHAAETWKGELQSITHSVVNIDAGRAITLEAKVKNTGNNYWLNSGIREVSVTPVSNPSKFHHEFWPNGNNLAFLLENRVNSGEIGTFRFAIQAPNSVGYFEEFFTVNVNGVGSITESFPIVINTGGVVPIPPPQEVTKVNIEQDIVDGSIPVPTVIQEEIITEEEIEVVEEDPEIINTTEETINEEEILTEENLLEEVIEITPVVQDVVATNIVTSEPTIRVGLYEADEFVIISSEKEYKIASEENSLGVAVPAETRAAVSFDQVSQKFLVTAGRVNVFSKTVQFIPEDDSYMTLLNFHKPVKWDPTLNDNKYRGTIEISLSEKTNSVWVINELPLETYLKGITETSEISPLEYHKSIAVAARSYAMWQMNDGTRHKGKGFDVDASIDQVYRGFNSEIRLPTFVQAVNDTEGIVVTHDGEVALTTYFAQSDGRTRDYEEVWGGIPLPYLKSVSDPTNDGLKLFGHGVGMSARGALVQASRDGKTFDEIINHYYTNIDLEKRYATDASPDTDI